MKRKVQSGEVVRIVRAPGGVATPGEEAVVEDIAGPNDAGTGWLVTLRLSNDTGADTLVVLSEDDVEGTGIIEAPQGERSLLDPADYAEDPLDFLELRLFTEITDVAEATRVADTIEHEIPSLFGGGTVSTEAERHWSAPYHYELAVSVANLPDAFEALQILAEAGGNGWLACRDDGWRVELVWSSTRDPDAMLIVPEVHAAEVAYLPWSNPARRPEEERPVVSVDVPQETPEEPVTAPEEDGDEAPEEPPSNLEPGDEEA